MTVHQRSITNSYLRLFSQLVSSVSRIDSAMQKGDLCGHTRHDQSAQCGDPVRGGYSPGRHERAPPTPTLSWHRPPPFSRVGDYASALACLGAANGGLSDVEAENLRALPPPPLSCGNGWRRWRVSSTMGAPIWNDVESVDAAASELSESGNVLAGSSYENIETNFP